MSNSRMTQPNTPIVEVPATTIDLSSPIFAKLVEQGETITSLALVCCIIWLLTQLIKVAKDD